jgi:membrane associated rhomboid family serine protease
MTGLAVLGVFLGLEIAGLRSGRVKNTDFTGHFGGLATGAMMAWKIRTEANEKKANVTLTGTSISFPGESTNVPVE